MSQQFSTALPLKITIVNYVVDKIDFFMIPFKGRIDEITFERRLLVEPFDIQPSYYLKLIIRELIRREILTYEHLIALLPEDTEELTCDEDTKFSPYQPNLIELILKRCRGLQVLHYHYFRGIVCEAEISNAILRDSIPRLNLRMINFYDARIEDETLNVIAKNCRGLQSLNLHKTGVSAVGIEFLCNESSVVKHSLDTLVIDYTDSSPLSIILCLLGFFYLKDFVSDQTLNACFRLLEIIEENIRNSGELVIFRTTVFKNSFKTHRTRTPPNNVLANFSLMFSNVNHLILTSIRKSCFRLINTLMPLMNITDLELSGDVVQSRSLIYTFTSLKRLLDSCGTKLTSLKLENFQEVNVYYLAEKCKNLNRLFLINNTYEQIFETKTSNLFKELIELQVILIRNCAYENSRQIFLSEVALYSLFSSSLLRKIVICCQACFSDILMGDLFEDEHLQNLNELYIYHCDQITDLTIWELIHNIRPIQKVEIGFSSFFTEELEDMLRNHIKEKKINISISRVTKNPYFFRWSVVDIPITERDQFNLDNDLNVNMLFQ